MTPECTTTDMYEGVVLQCCGMEFLGIAGWVDNRAVLAFKDPLEKGKDVINGYYSGKIQVNALEFVNSLRTLKSVIRNSYKRGESHDV